jgi:transposase
VTVTAETEAEVRRLFHAEHWKVGTIASQLVVHEDVVRRVLGMLDRAPAVARPRAQLVEPYVDFITETLARYPRLRATRLWDMVKERGYAGGVRTLRTYVAGVRPRPRHEVFLRTDPLVGEQAQVDWAYVGDVQVSGGRRPLWLFVMVLAWSRALWGEFVIDLTVHSLLRSLSRAAVHFGGSCRQWLFDNPKIVVLERHGDAVRFHPLLLELSGRFHVQLRVCAPRKANQKGRVERAIRYLRDRFLGGREIVGVDQGNRALDAFRDEIAAARPHPTQHGRTVRDCFVEEKSKLLPLPDPLPPTDLVMSVESDKTAFVRFDRNIYSVPSVYAQRTVTLVADDRIVRLLDGAAVFARHVRCWGRRQIIELPEHRQDILAQKRGAREVKGRDRLRAGVPDIDALFARWVEVGRNVGSMTAHTLKLLDLYGDSLLAQAVTEVIARGVSDPGAVAQVCEQLRRAAARPVPFDVALGDHVPDRDVIPHDLETYDAKRRRP